MDLEEWIFRVGYSMGQMGISFGRMDFSIFYTVLFCYANSSYYLSYISLLFLFIMCLIYFVIRSIELCLPQALAIVNITST